MHPKYNFSWREWFYNLKCKFTMTTLEKALVESSSFFYYYYYIFCPIDFCTPKRRVNITIVFIISPGGTPFYVSEWMM